jgi:hypothetical protein
MAAEAAALQVVAAALEAVALLSAETEAAEAAELCRPLCSSRTSLLMGAVEDIFPQKKCHYNLL